jgi:hypothetical protein
MREDAKMWRHMAAELSEAAHAVSPLGLNAWHFSDLGEWMFGLTELYGSLQTRMITLMTQGAANFETVANALLTAAAGYEEDERRGVHQFKNIY